MAAQPAAAPPSSPSAADVSRARALFEAGGRAYDDAKFDVALKAFQQAYAIVPRDGLLFSIAQTHRRLYTTTGDAAQYAEAVKLYREYVSKAGSGGRKADAVRALEELEARPPAGGVPAPSPTATAAPAPVASQTLLYAYSSTPGVLVSLDGGKPTPPDTFSVKPGLHKLRFSAPGFVDHEMEVEALNGELVPVSKDLEEKPAKLDIDTSDGAEVSVDGRFIGEAPLTAPLELTSGTHFIAVQKVGRKTRAETVVLARDAKKTLDLGLDTTVQRDVSFAILGSAGAAVVASGVLAGFAIARHNQAQEIIDLRETTGIDEAQLSQYDDARVERDRFVIASAAVGGAGIALGVLGIGLMFADPPERAVPSQLRPTPSDEKKDERRPPTEMELVGVAPIVGPDGFGAQALFQF